MLACFLLFIAITYPLCMLYFGAKSQKVIDNIISQNPNGYPYVNRIRGFNNQ